MTNGDICHISWELSAHRIETDVAVVGGGTAGCFAAICAAKCGAETLLIEKASMLGGTVTTAGVAFPGLFHAWGQQIIDGPCWQSIQHAASLGGVEIPDIVSHPKYHWQEQVRVDRFVYACVLNEMCRESGCSVMLHTMLCDAQDTTDGVLMLLSAKEGPLLVHAKQVIDATGDANLVGMLGFPLLYSCETQPATLIQDLAGYMFEDLDRAEFDRFLQKQTSIGNLLPEDSQGASLWDQLCNHRISMHIHADCAETSVGRSNLEQKARASLMRVVSVLRQFPGLEQLHVCSFAEECGVRETVRIDGETYMQAADYIAGTRYPDAICYAFYPVDRHEPTGIHQIFLKQGTVPTISFGSLRPKGAKKLLVAGRCISCDRDTQSAVRVAAPCMAMGQAAGVAAALAVQLGCGVDDVPYPSICRLLRQLGAIVP